MKLNDAGKGGVGMVLKAFLGTNMSNSSIAKIETNSFARADLETVCLLKRIEII